MKNFDKMFICWMDRIVWFILMMVFSNLLVEITGVPPRKVINIPTQQNDLSHLNEISIPKDVEMINKEIKIKKLITLAPAPINVRFDSKIEVDDKGKIIGQEQQKTIFDSIFNIPISTLKAVNHLVQAIFGSLTIPGTLDQQTQNTVTQQSIKHKYPYTKDFNFTILRI